MFTFWKNLAFKKALQAWAANVHSWVARVRPWLVNVRSWVARVRPWLARVRSWVARVRPWLVNVRSWVARVRPWLARVRSWVARSVRSWVARVRSWLARIRSWLANIRSWAARIRPWLAVARPWLAGARPRTLPASLVPVIVGTAAADAVANGSGLIWWRAIFALIVSLSLQVGVNFANDYSDGVRGTDATRVGPQRLVASGAVAPAAVKRAAVICFFVAAATGFLLAVALTWWLLVIGGACIFAAWYYTGGSRPYGYSGWGELAVFVFFGLVATAGSAYVQDAELTPLALGAAVPVGLSAVALLVANNLRDLPRDGAVGKLTLAVRLGDKITRGFYVGLLTSMFISVPYLALVRPWALVALVALPLAISPARTVIRGATDSALLPVLAGTARLQLVFGVLLCAGLAYGA